MTTLQLGAYSEGYKQGKEDAMNHVLDEITIMWNEANTFIDEDGKRMSAIKALSILADRLMVGKK